MWSDIAAQYRAKPGGNVDRIKKDEPEVDENDQSRGRRLTGPDAALPLKVLFGDSQPTGDE